MKHILITYTLFFFSLNTQALHISGRLYDYLTSVPIESSTVLLDGFSPGATRQTAVSDTDGFYSFPDVAAGVFKLIIEDIRFVPDTVWLTVGSDTTISFNLYKIEYLLDSIPDTLNKRTLPYLVNKTINVRDHNVTFLPGVVIHFVDKGGIQFSGSEFTAVGTLADPVVFNGNIADSTLLGTVTMMRSGGGIYTFNYCRFENINSLVIDGYKTANIENCFFTKMRRALVIYYKDISQDLFFRNNTIINCREGITGMSGASDYYDFMGISITITENLIWCTDIALRLSPDKKGYVTHNTVIGLTSINMARLQETDTVMNNIFTNLRFDNISNSMLYFAYNLVGSFHENKLPGVGIPVKINSNGDSCDYFYNLFMDPQIVDSATGMIYDKSPCIDAASDGTNIGIYQGEAAGIKIRNIQSGTRSKRLLFLRIANHSFNISLPAEFTFPADNVKVSFFTLSGKLIITSESGIDQAGNITINNRIDRQMNISHSCILFHVQINRIQYTVPLMINKYPIYKVF